MKKNFLWGGAIAANQTEGAYQEGNRGLCLADVLPAGKERFWAYDHFEENRKKIMHIILRTTRLISITDIKRISLF